MAQTETVTVMITDLVGSTGLESRIGPGAADELRAEHFGLIRSALGEKGGREVKNTGDGLMVAFDSAADAVACAVAVQQRLERRNRNAASSCWSRSACPAAMPACRAMTTSACR